MNGTENPKDRVLIQRIADKDKTAFETLYRRYFHRVSQFVFNMVRQPETAEEIVDDTMFAIWRSAAAFQGRSAVSTWILGIAYRRALKTLERNRKHRSVETDMEAILAQADLNPGSSPEAISAERSLRNLLQRGIDTLSDDHRTALQLTTMGYSYSEISEIVGCPHNTVKTRMFHARRQLRNFLATSEYRTHTKEERRTSCVM